MGLHRELYRAMHLALMHAVSLGSEDVEVKAVHDDIVVCNRIDCHDSVMVRFVQF